MKKVPDEKRILEMRVESVAQRLRLSDSMLIELRPRIEHYLKDFKVYWVVELIKRDLTTPPPNGQE